MLCKSNKISYICHFFGSVKVFLIYHRMIKGRRIHNNFGRGAGMKGFLKAFSIFVILGIVVLCAIFLEFPGGKHIDQQAIPEWQIIWTDEFDPNMSTESLDSIQSWERIGTNERAPERPSGKHGQWVKIEVPPISSRTPAILFEKIYASHIVVKIKDETIYESHRNYRYSVNTLLLPLDSKSAENPRIIYLGMDSMKRIGPQGSVLAGDYNDLQEVYIKNNIIDFIIGSALIFVAAIMLICSLFLKNENMSGWFSLCFLILSGGTLVLTYSPFLYSLFGSLGNVYVALFDLSLFILLPSFTIFLENIFGKGYKSIITKYRKFQVGYSALCIILLLCVNLVNNSSLERIYEVLSETFISLIMILQFILMIVVSIIYTIRGNQEAIIFSIGFAIFSVFGLGELIWFFFKEAYYELFLWKWGIVCFLIALIIILGKRFSENHDQIVEYSRQLEMFNNELQRSEKMEIISELAASVAHEVRNPLQVTRGFLQLLAAKQNSADKVYLSMALEELDRASNIITDFLTFAKPEVGKVTTLNVLEEFIHIEGFLVPMANLQGGRLTVQIPRELNIKGNSSKFKQAFINIIKNSIESLHGEGEIQAWAYEEKGEVCIHIKDNGEGMDEEVLTRLGEPYFSNKTKGTGLGLMVTFRIIEVMNGRIQFRSEKGAGTEVIIHFPAVDPA